MPFSYGNVLLKLFLSYVNELCIYPRLLSFFKSVRLRLRTHKGSTNQCVLLTIYLLGKLPFFKVHVNHFIAWMTHLVPVLSVHLKMCVVGEGPGATLSFEISPFSN